jgi:hypothetical protein
MKKIIGFILSAVTLLSVAVMARAAGPAVLAVYDDGVLVYVSSSVKDEDNTYNFVIPDEYAKLYLKLYNVDEDATYNVITESDATEAAETAQPEEATETPQPTAEATEKPTAEPTKTPYPEVYEKALDAVNAPAVVQEVSEQVIDGETYFVTRMLYQGVEITSNIRDTVQIESAPAAQSGLIGQSAEALKAGDVIHFTCDLQHKVKSIEFIYRPDFTDYINSGISMSNLVGSDKYSTFYFGAVVKTAKGYVLLANANGKTTDIDISDGTFVYTVSKRARGDKAELSGTGSGAVSYNRIPNSYLDDNDNVISWDDIEPTYALLRVRNGSATEIIVFEN